MITYFYGCQVQSTGSHFRPWHPPRQSKIQWAARVWYARTNCPDAPQLHPARDKQEIQTVDINCVHWEDCERVAVATPHIECEHEQKILSKPVPAHCHKEHALRQDTKSYSESTTCWQMVQNIDPQSGDNTNNLMCKANHFHTSLFSTHKCYMYFKNRFTPHSTQELNSHEVCFHVTCSLSYEQHSHQV